MRSIAFVVSSLLALTACASEDAGDSGDSATGGSASTGAGGGEGGNSSAAGSQGSTSTGNTGGASSSASSAAVGGAATSGPAGVGGSGVGAGGAASGTAAIAWSNLQISQPSCWLFSDPGLLGATAEWAVDGGSATLEFAAAGRSYSGSWPAAPTVLSGTHQDTFEGDTWKYAEKFQGTVNGNTFTGTWSYTECNFSDDPAGCPADGLCTGSAGFVITLPE
jgi:hypothetical protein